MKNSSGVLAKPGGFVRGKFLLVIGCVLLVVLVSGVLAIQPIRDLRTEKQFNLSTQYLEEADYTRALEAFAKVLERDSARVDARLGKAKSLVGLTRQTEAETVLLEIIELDPTVSEAYGLLVKIYIQKGDIAGALDLVSKGADGADQVYLGALLQGLDSKISIHGDLHKLDAGKGATVRLLWAVDGEELLLAPLWSLDNDAARMEQNTDGSIVVSMDVAGEVKVSAVLGPLSREITLSYSAKDWAKEAAQFVETSSIPFALPAFTNPNELDNDKLILFLFLRISRKSGEDWVEIVSAQELELEARKVFGPGIKEIIPESVWSIEWNSENQEYELIPRCFDGSHMTFILDYSDAGSQYVVDVVHLRREFTWEGEFEDDETIIVYDEDNTLLGKFAPGDDVFDEETLSALPMRRYLFTKLEDGGFYLAQSLIVR